MPDRVSDPSRYLRDTKARGFPRNGPDAVRARTLGPESSFEQSDPVRSRQIALATMRNTTTASAEMPISRKNARNAAVTFPLPSSADRLQPRASGDVAPPPTRRPGCGLLTLPRPRPQPVLARRAERRRARARAATARVSAGETSDCPAATRKTPLTAAMRTPKAAPPVVASMAPRAASRRRLPERPS